MPIKVKTGTSTWSTIKKIWVKTGTSTWSAGTKLFGKVSSGWVQMWPGNAPASSLTDPIDIRLTGYNGARATSPQYINTVLYGNDGTITGDTPITINYRRMYISESSSGNTTRYQLETTDIFNLTSNSETNIGYKRFMANGWYLFYQLEAENSSGASLLYSPAIKIIKQSPTFTTNSPSLSEDYSSSNPFFSLSFSFSDTWWKSADLSRSYIKWWQNTSKSPGGTALKTTYIQNISGLSTTRSGGTYEEHDGQGTTVSGNDYYTAIGGVPSGQYIIAEVVLINSYTDHFGTPVSAYVSSGDKATITNLTVKDDNGNSIVDNQSVPRIISDGYLNFTATVSNASSSTYYLLEPRFYNWQTGVYYDWNSTTVISSTSFPTDLTPTSSSLSGTTATVTWRIYINADTLYGMGGPTYGGGNSRWELEFRVSARASASSTNASASYFNGIASLGGTSIYLGGIDIPGAIDIAPSSAMTLNVSTTAAQINNPVTFSISTVSYPSGYASYPRRYYIDYGDGTNSGWVSFSTGTSNPSVTSISKTYTSTGTYTASLIWEPQGDTSRSTRSRTITVSPALNPPTSVSVASVSRNDNSSISVSINFSGGSGPYYQLYWVNSSSTPVTASYDAASTGSPITDTFSPGDNYTAYFYVRSSSENLGNTTNGGTGTAGLYSSYSSLSPNPSYTFLQPTGSVSVSPSSGTAGSTQFTATPSVSSSPASQITYNWQYYEGGMIGWASVGSYSQTYTPPSNYTSLYGTQLRCQITANNGVGNSLTVASTAVSVSAPATKLSTPTNVSASDNRSDGILVSWTNVANASTYGVWYGGQPSYDSTPDFGGPTNRGGKTITGTPFLDDVVGTGTTRDYYVQAFPTSGSTTYLKSDWSAGDFGTRIAAPVKLSTPTGLSATTTRTDGILISWSPVSGADYYGVWYRGGAPSYDSPPDFGGPNNPGLITGTSYLDTSIGSGVTRSYDVQAFKSGNPTGTKSEYGGPVTGTRAAAGSAPSTPTGVNTSSSGAVTWNAVSGATSYTVEYYLASGSSGNNAYGPLYSSPDPTGTSYQIAYGTYNGVYLNYARARVRANNSFGSSAYSGFSPASGYV